MKLLGFSSRQVGKKLELVGGAGKPGGNLVPLLFLLSLLLVSTFLTQTFGFAFLKYILKTRMFRLTRSINKETTLKIMG